MNKKGVTLVEALVSISMLTVFMLAFSAFLLSAKKEVIKQRKDIVLAFKMRSQLEEDRINGK